MIILLNNKSVLLKDKGVLDSKFELNNLKNSFKELENLDDLWYLVRSNSASWVAGSAS